MPVFEVGLDDGRKLRIEADDQEAALAGVAHFQAQEGAKAPSGFGAGVVHGAQEWAHGNAETAKDFLGIGNGFEPTDTGYVPANVTNGSANPLNWNWSQVPQKVAEQAPGLAQDVVAATAASKMAPGGLKAKALAGLLGGAASAWHRTAGDTAKEAAANRTGDAAASPTSEDLLKGGLTAAAAAVPGAIPATRFIPGANKIGTVGAQGALDSIKKYLATTAVGGAGAAGSDAITQAGTTLGTDKKFDPSRTLEAAAGGLVTAGTLAAPRAAADTVRATGLREFGGDNMDATKNYATRLKTAGDGELGNTIGGAKNDYTAHETVKTDLKNELRDAARNVRRDLPLGPDADNALQRAQNGDHLTPKDIALIESATAAAPDGSNASFLARTLRVAQLAQERGTYNSRGEWAGGVSGLMDKNLGFMMNPVRLAGGTIATGMGMHLLGLSNPLFAGSVAGGYLGARALDSMAGTRSPAKMFAQHFADHNAQLRIPQTPQAPAAPPTPTAPWGPRPPMSGPTGPTVAPPAPLPQAPAPGLWGPKPLPTTSVPPVAPPGPPAPPAVNPLALPRDITSSSKTLMSALANVAQMKAKHEAEKAVGTLDAPLLDEAPLDVTRNPYIGKRASSLVSAAKALSKLTADPAAEKTATGLSADATASPAAAKITKSKGKVESTAQAAAPDSAYEPLPEEHLYPKDISAKAYAMREAQEYGARSPSYLRKAEVSAQKRIDAEAALVAKYPQFQHAIKGLVRQLHRVGSNTLDKERAVDLYASHVSPEAGQAIREAFK